MQNRTGLSPSKLAELLLRATVVQSPGVIRFSQSYPVVEPYPKFLINIVISIVANYDFNNAFLVFCEVFCEVLCVRV